jgi:hypothetical protein
MGEQAGREKGKQGVMNDAPTGGRNASSCSERGSADEWAEHDDENFHLKPTIGSPRRGVIHDALEAPRWASKRGVRRMSRG